MMESRALPGTPLVVSRIAFGCAGMGGYDYGPVDDAESIRAVHRALEIGVSFFDTADVYGLGRAETILGRALDGERRRAVIATKGGVRWDASGPKERTLDPSWLVTALEGSLRRLGTDCIDLYQLHWPVPNANLDDVWDALEKCRAAGKLRAIGCSNFAPAESTYLSSLGCLASEQLGFNLLDRAAEPALTAATRSGRLTLTYNSLAQGLLAGRRRGGEKFAGTDLRARYGYFKSAQLPDYLAVLERVEQVAAGHGRTPLQVALRWALDQECVGVVITGMKHPWQVEENAAAAGWSLTGDERAFLEGGISNPSD